MNYNFYRGGSPFRIGDRVKVIKQRKYPNEKLLGLFGTVRSAYYGNDIAVNLDECTNTRSSHGWYYFRAVDLVHEDEHENEIMEEKNMEKITGYLNCVRVMLSGTNESNKSYYANFEPDLKVGDICVVSNGFHFSVATVTEIVDFAVETHNEVVAKVHTDVYNTRIEARARAAELKAKMEARAKQLQDVALYKMLAENDPDMADLLHEYQELSKV